jgi:MFS family permease
VSSKQPVLAGGDSRRDGSKLPRTVVVLGVVSFLHDLGGDLATPLLPAFVATLGAGPAALGVIEGAADAVASLLKLLSGHVADRTGRLKALTLAGYLIANSIRPILAIATSWWQVLVVRVGDRVGKGLRSSPRDALLANATPEEIRGRAYGFHHALEYAGSMAGPAIGFLLLSAGTPLRPLLAWSAVPGLVAVLVLALAVREPWHRPVAKAHLGLPPDRAFRRFLAAAVVFTLGNSSDAFLLWRAHELGVGTAFAPVLWVVLHLTRSATSIWGGALSDRKGRRFAIVAGWAVYALVYLAFGVARTTWHAWVLFAVYGLYHGLTESALKAFTVDLVEASWRGRALGAYHAAVGLATLPASVVFGFVYREAGPLAAFGLGAMAAVIAAFILATVRPPGALNRIRG